MERPVLEMDQSQKLLVQVPQGPLVRVASQSPSQLHLADEECFHRPRHHRAVETIALVLEPHLDIGKNPQLTTDGGLDLLPVVADPAELCAQ